VRCPQALRSKLSPELVKCLIGRELTGVDLKGIAHEPMHAVGLRARHLHGRSPRRSSRSAVISGEQRTATHVGSNSSSTSSQSGRPLDPAHGIRVPRRAGPRRWPPGRGPRRCPRCLSQARPIARTGRPSPARRAAQNTGTRIGSSGAFSCLAVRWPVANLRCWRTGLHGRPGRRPPLVRRVPLPRLAPRGIQAGHR
jgi:hypothetical protein